MATHLKSPMFIIVKTTLPMCGQKTFTKILLAIFIGQKKIVKIFVKKHWGLERKLSWKIHTIFTLQNIDKKSTRFLFSRTSNRLKLSWRSKRESWKSEELKRGSWRLKLTIKLEELNWFYSSKLEELKLEELKKGGAELGRCWPTDSTLQALLISDVLFPKYENTISLTYFRQNYLHIPCWRSKSWRQWFWSHIFIDELLFSSQILC